MTQRKFNLGEEIAVLVLVPPAIHVGTITGFLPDGTPLVTSNSARHGHVVEEPFADFTQGGIYWSNGFRGRLSPAVVAARARSLIGTRWTVEFNCEDFVRLAAGQKSGSPQRAFWTLLGLAALAIALSRG